jgi:coenzyme PQQ precursor peptide PqqA
MRRVPWRAIARSVSRRSVEAGLPRDWQRRRTWRRNVMEWRTPKLVEIACGCEINAYFPADL